MKTLPCNTSWVINKNNTVGGEIYTYLVDEIQKKRLKLCLVAVTAPFPSGGKLLFEAKIGLKDGLAAEFCRHETNKLLFKAKFSGNILLCLVLFNPLIPQVGRMSR